VKDHGLSDRSVRDDMQVAHFMTSLSDTNAQRAAHLPHRKLQVLARLPAPVVDDLYEDGMLDQAEEMSREELEEIVRLRKELANERKARENAEMRLLDAADKSGAKPKSAWPDAVRMVRVESTAMSDKEKVLSEWRTHLLERGHNQQKRTILKQLLLEEFGSLDENARLAALFHRIGNLYKRYLSRYETYVAEVSVEKVLEKLEKDKLEWLGKINKAVTDLNAQILGVPLATLLAGARLVGNPDDALANLIVVVAIVIFVFLLLQSIRMQKHHVEVLNQTLGSEREILERRHMALKDEIEKVFDALEKQVNATRRRLASYRFLGWLLFLLTAGYYLVTISPELKDFLLQFYRTGPR